ncbi:MAG: AraC family transcriptional regulator [Bacteroidota bacterium]
MLLIPQRLFELPTVRTLLTDGHSCILRKQLQEPTLGRESYIGTVVLSLVRQGKQVIRTYEGEQLEVRAGQFAILPKGIYTISDLIPEGEAFETLLFFFSDQLIDEFLSGQRHQQGDGAVEFGQRYDSFAGIQVFAQALIDLYGDATKQEAVFVRLKLLELLHLLQGQALLPNFTSFLAHTRTGKPRNLRRFMEANFDKPLKVEDYAYLTGRSLSSFRRDFKQFFGATPQQWLKNRRLEKAHDLLLTQGMTITAVAYEVGYEHISYFIKAFKQKYALTPKQLVLERREEELG